MWKSSCVLFANVKKKNNAPVASFVKEYIDLHPTFVQVKLDKRLSRLNEAWAKLPKTKQEYYLKNPLKGLQPPVKK